MKFPHLVYRTPGNHHCLGGTFDYFQVKNQQQFSDAVKAGWYPSLPEAISGELNAVETEVDETEVDETEVDETEVDETEVDEEAPPTREELEEKAKELGIGFNKNTKDETLLEKIEAALED